jgi:hypothetical protein
MREWKRGMIGSLDAGNRLRDEFVGQTRNSCFRKCRHKDTSSRVYVLSVFGQSKAWASIVQQNKSIPTWGLKGRCNLLTGIREIGPRPFLAWPVQMPSALW